MKWARRNFSGLCQPQIPCISVKRIKKEQNPKNQMCVAGTPVCWCVVQIAQLQPDQGVEHDVTQGSGCPVCSTESPQWKLNPFRPVRLHHVWNALRSLACRIHTQEIKFLDTCKCISGTPPQFIILCINKHQTWRSPLRGGLAQQRRWATSRLDVDFFLGWLLHFSAVFSLTCNEPNKAVGCQWSQLSPNGLDLFFSHKKLRLIPVWKKNLFSCVCVCVCFRSIS